MEKLPINNFRLDFIDHLFPTSRFVHLVRHGLEVARSIARTGPRWYGANHGQKWRLLCDHATAVGWSPSELAVNNPMQRGLIEWTLSLNAVDAMKSKLTADRFFEVRYDALIDDPQAAIADLFQFLDVDVDPDTMAWAVDTFRRRSPPADHLDCPPDISPRTRELLSTRGFTC